MSSPDRFEFDALCLQEGPGIMLEAVRGDEAVLRDGIGRTLSADAMEALLLNIKGWIGSRMVRSMDFFDHVPLQVSVVVMVGIDGEAAR